MLSNSKIEERNKSKLTFEILTGLDSKVTLIPHKETLNLGHGLEPIEIDEYIIKAYLYIRFRNKDVHRTTVEQMKLSLLRRSESENEQEIPVEKHTLDVYPPNAPTANAYSIRISDGIPVSESDLTSYYQFHYNLEIERAEIQSLNSDYFLRLSMTTITGQTYSLDIDNIDWESATNRHAYVFSQNVGSMPSL